MVHLLLPIAIKLDFVIVSMVAFGKVFLKVTISACGFILGQCTFFIAPHYGPSWVNADHGNGVEGVSLYWAIFGSDFCPHIKEDQYAKSRCAEARWPNRAHSDRPLRMPIHLLLVATLAHSEEAPLGLTADYRENITRTICKHNWPIF